MAWKIVIIMLTTGLIVNGFAQSPIEQQIYQKIDGILQNHLKVGISELAKQNTTCLSFSSNSSSIENFEKALNLSSLIKEVSFAVRDDLLKLAKTNFTLFMGLVRNVLMPASSATTVNKTEVPPSSINNALMSVLGSTGIGKILLGPSTNTQKLQALFQIATEQFSSDLLALVDNECYSDVLRFFGALSNRTTWAIQMLDAFGKPPAGILRGNLNLIGSYDECKAVVAAYGKRSKTTGARYCKSRISPPDGVMGARDTKGVDLKITVGMCVPDSCYSKDIKALFQLPAIRNYTDILSHDIVCYEEKTMRKDTSAITAVIIYSLVLFLIVVGTLNETIKSLTKESDNSEIKEHKLDGKSTGYTNNAYVIDEDKPTTANGKVQEQNGKPNNLGHGNELPPGYMPHAEGDSKNPTYIPPSRNKAVLADTKVDISDISLKLTEENPILKNYKEQKEESIRQENSSKKSDDSILVRVVKAFSVKTNAPKILAGGSGSGSIDCIHGIRFLSISWIILGHTYNYGLASRINETWSIVNALDAFEILKRFTFQGVYGAGFSVDTFYMLSGLLLTYLQLKHLGKLMKKAEAPKVAFYVFHYYFHRFWRLTPMYMAVLMFFGCLYRYIGSGPLWVPEAGDTCKTNWWTNFLYVNNLVNVPDMCMGWSWFLANDMQFYVVSIIFLFFLTWSIPLGTVLIFLLMSAGIGIAGWKEHIYNGSFLTFKSDGGAFWKNVYIAPWCRVAAFCVGLLTGIIMYKIPRKVLNRKLALIGWAIAVALGLALVYCTYSENKEGGTPWSRNFRAAYESLGRPLWAVCVAWVIFACHNGRGGIVNSILSWNGLVPLSRLSYAAYLVHPIIMMINVYSKRSLVYLSDIDIIYLYLGHMVLTFMSAFVVSLAFEAPFMALEKIMFPPKR